MDMQDREYEVGYRSSVPAWQRAVARIVLVTFTTGFVGCGGGAAQEAQTTTTVTAVEAIPTTLPPATIPPPPPQPPATPPSTMPEQAPEQLSKDELRDLVAPVALYPDVVLSSLLPATTYPEQLHDAAEYVGQAEVIDRIPDDRGWDGSVVGLLQFPDVIRWLDGNPAWTDQMGQAVTYQQGDVLDAIQDYRRAVKTAGNLQSNQYQKVRAAPNEDIYIEPARPDVVYVPSYDPVIATQPQQQVVVAESPGINPWIAFGGGAVVGALGAWALYSIFDDDDHGNNNYYYGGGGRRRIRGYDNYYYARGRRPGTVAWAPRNRQPYRRVNGWKEPRRLQYAAPVARPGKRPAALRPPTKRVGAPAPYATDLKRDQRNGNRQGQNGQMQGGAPQLNKKQQRQQDKQVQQQQRQQQKQIQQQQQIQRKTQQGGGGGGGKGKQGQGQGQGQQRDGSRQKSQQQQQRRQQQPKRMDEPRQEQQRQQQEGQRERRNDQPKQQKQHERNNDGVGQKQGGGGGNGNGGGGGGKKGGDGGGKKGGGGNKKKNKQGND